LEFIGEIECSLYRIAVVRAALELQLEEKVACGEDTAVRMTAEKVQGYSS
jgi:hypothetical protein